LAVGTLNPAPQAEAIRRVYPSVLGKLLGFTRSLADAEDAVHDAVALRAIVMEDIRSPGFPGGVARDGCVERPP
jgi:hypothetical protein